MAIITPDTDIMHMVVRWPETADVLHAHDFVKIQHTAGTAGTVGRAALFHKVDLDSLLEDLNRVVDRVERERALHPPQKKHWKDR